MPPSATTGTAAPPTPAAPAAGTAPAPPSGDSTPMQTSFGALDGYLNDEPSPAPEPPGSTPPPSDANADPMAGLAAEPAKSAPKPEAKTTPKTAPKPEAKPKPEGDPEIPEKGVPRQFRDAYAKLKEQVKSLESRIAEKKEDPTKTKDDPERKALEERLAEREKRLSELDQEMEFTNYERSSAYQKQYWEPFVNTFNEGRELVAQLKVNADGEERTGAPADFDKLMKITDPNEAAEFASELFGNAAPEVLAMRREVVKANNARINALNEFKGKRADREKAQTERLTEMVNQFKTVVNQAVEKYPQWFKPTDGESIDKKANELLEKGMARADSMFDREAQQKMSDQELINFHGMIRNKAGAFDRVAYELSKATKRISELQAKLDAIESSTPGAGTPRGSKPTDGGELDWQKKLDEIASPG